MRSLQSTDARVSFLAFTPMASADGVGCEGHPTAATHAAMGELLGREPEVAGNESYVDQSLAGGTPGTVEAEIKASAEKRKGDQRIAFCFRHHFTVFG